MPTVRTNCPMCETVIVDAASMTLRRRPDAHHTECTFTCPTCITPVVQSLTERMVPVLLGAGCQVEPGTASAVIAPDHESIGGRITETEIALFLTDLERADCLDELDD